MALEATRLVSGEICDESIGAPDRSVIIHGVGDVDDVMGERFSLRETLNRIIASDQAASGSPTTAEELLASLLDGLSAGDTVTNPTSGLPMALDDIEPLAGAFNVDDYEPIAFFNRLDELLASEMTGPQDVRGTITGFGIQIGDGFNEFMSLSQNQTDNVAHDTSEALSSGVGLTLEGFRNAPDCIDGEDDDADGHIDEGDDNVGGIDCDVAARLQNITAEMVFNRANAQTCAGCHNTAVGAEIAPRHTMA